MSTGFSRFACSGTMKEGVFLLFAGLSWVWIEAHVAQLVEHILGKDEVSGSIPLMGSSAGRPGMGYRQCAREQVLDSTYRVVDQS